MTALPRPFKSILEDYEMTSRQVINIQKHSIFFEHGVAESFQTEVIEIMGMIKCEGEDKYLGLPYLMDRTKKKNFQFVKDRVAKKVGGWKERLLSQVGKEFFIKSMPQVIPTYGICDEIAVMIRKFWWGKMSEVKEYIGKVGGKWLLQKL